MPVASSHEPALRGRLSKRWISQWRGIKTRKPQSRFCFTGEQSLFGGLAGRPGGSVGRSHGRDASLISIEQASIPDIRITLIQQHQKWTQSVRPPNLHLQTAPVECDCNSPEVLADHIGRLQWVPAISPPQLGISPHVRIHPGQSYDTL